MELKRLKRQKAMVRLKRLNHYLSDLEVITGRTQLQSRPPHLEIDFSNRCNIRCVMCHQAKLYFAHTTLDAGDVDAIIKVLPHIETILIAGLGEPLLFRPIGKFLHLSRLFGCKTEMFTNGVLIGRRMDVFAYLDKVHVSFDGATATVFERLRVGADFDRIVTSLVELRKRYPLLKIAFSTVLSCHNVREIDGIAAIAARVGANEVNISPVSHTPELQLKLSDWPVFQEHIERARGIGLNGGVAINNNVRQEHFTAEDDGDVSMKTFLGTATTRRRAITPLHNSSYAPNRQVEEPITQEALDNMLILVDEEIAELRRIIKEVKQEIHRLKIQSVFQPYCTAPWKYAFAQHNGSARLCPYWDQAVGKINDGVLTHYNSAFLEDLRRSFVRGRPEIDVCRTCTDDHRHFGLDSIRKTCNSLGIRMESRTYSS